jgi:ubiquinone/menaquinone biosynthesis C-methylase UbiE
MNQPALNISSNISTNTSLAETPVLIDALAQKLKACGDTLRLQILQVLKLDAFGVLELTQLFETKQSGMSHHLKVLSKAGLVEAQREGNAIFYRRPFQSSEPFEAIACSNIFSMVDQLSLSRELEQRIQDIRAQRAVQSQAFFERNTERFVEQQELISNYEQYASASFELVKSALPEKNHRILEVGPGEGRFLKPLAVHYQKVVALDTSDAMLNKARSYCEQEGLSNVEFILGDTQKFSKSKQTADAVVMNMVLHHVPTPSEIFMDCHDILNEQGVLVVCDLSHHHQDWAKENCGDLWLGFETEELITWAQRAGFREDESVFIGLRNGFQIQLHRFIKD